MIRLGAAGWLVVALAACEEETPVEGPDMRCRRISVTQGQAGVGQLGRPFSVNVAMPLDCVVLGSVVGTVTGPDNTAVPSSTAQAATQNLKATVTFTPEVTGPYHVEVRFDPNRGLGQVDVVVAPDAVAQPVLTTDVPALARCRHLELSPAGLALCSEDGVSVWSIRGGVPQLVQELPKGRAARVGSTLWLASTIADAGELSRWVEGTRADGGPGFTQDPASSLAIEPDMLVAPGEADAVLVQRGDRQQVRVATAASGGWLEGQVQFNGLGTGSILTVWRDGEQVGTVSNRASALELCKWKVDGGTVTCGTFLREPSLAIAGGAGGFWLARSASNALQRWNARLVGAVDLSQTFASELESTVWNSQPVVHGGGTDRLLPQGPDDALFLERAPGIVTSATKEYFATADAGTVTLWRR